MRLDFETGLAFGQALQRLRSLESRVGRIERKLELAEGYLRRALLVAALWGAAAALKLNGEELGQVLAELVRSLLRTGS